MKRLFHPYLKAVQKPKKKEETVRSKYMPAEETPIEEGFTLKFTEQGEVYLL
ncbi:MAG: hypothetical protein CM15mP83_6220 [Flavobacteriaceae bacterium]|nr:MAG: hypothetical protein CM15mP83_6220 [Flavobacteriaceae bacterium]